MDAAKFLDELVKNPGYKGQIVHVEDIPARPAVYGELEQPLLPQMREIWTWTITPARWVEEA